MNNLPTGYTARAATMDDVPALADLINARTQRHSGRDGTTLGRLRGQFEFPGLDLEDGTRVVFAPDGALVAFGLVMDWTPPHVQLRALGPVHHDHLGRGIGTALEGWIEARARRAIDRAPDGARVVLHQSAFDVDRTAADFLAARGYAIVRHFWRMGIDLAAPPPPPVWPDGVDVVRLNPQVELRAAFEAIRGVFRDHWGFTDDASDEGFAQFHHQMETDPTFDPAFFTLVKDANGEIVAFCFGAPDLGTGEGLGLIQAVGVTRPWRRRGLALALLHHTFGAFRRAGGTKASLYVDAENLTGATRLYEKAGMHVTELSHEYEKELRAGADLTTRDSE